MPKLDESVGAAVQSQRAIPRPKDGEGGAIPVRQGRHGLQVAVPPRGIIVVSWSEIDTARQCPLKHELSYIERWSEKQKANGALAKGTLWHNVLEAHYRSLMSTQAEKAGGKHLASVADRFQAARTASEGVLRQAEADAGSDFAVQETIDLIAWMYEGYLDMWGTSPDWHILATEHAAQVRLPNLKGGKSRFALKLKIDLVIQARTSVLQPWRTYIVDHKSGKDLPKDKDFDFMDQFKLYAWSLRSMDKKIFGTMYSAARTFKGVNEDKKPAALETRFSRTPMSQTDTELNRCAVEAFQDISARYRQQIEVDRAGGESPRHTDPQTCGWRCSYTEPCLHGRRGGDLRDYLTGLGFRQSFERH